MGIIYGQGTFDYLIDVGGYISAFPYPLFELIDNAIPSTWFFKAFKNTDEEYPYQEAISGYYELVFEKGHYEKLINMDKEALEKYFKWKNTTER